MAWIAIYAIEEERVVLVTSSMMGNADVSMVMEAIIVFDVMDERMQEGIIPRFFSHQMTSMSAFSLMILKV